jgi:hypothetical protein
MSEKDRHFVHNDEVAFCQYHYCVILNDIIRDAHDTLSCSGTIARFGDDKYYYNPITPLQPNFGKLLKLPSSMVDFAGSRVFYYYMKDIRTRFPYNIEDVSCTNDLKTCVTTVNGTKHCWGNVEGKSIIHSKDSMLLGLGISLFCGAAVFFILHTLLRRRSNYVSNTTLYILFALLVTGAALIFLGLFLAEPIPCIAGIIVPPLIFPILYHFFSKIRKKSF